MERAAEILKETGVEQTLEREFVGPGATRKRRGPAIALGLIVIGIGVVLLFFSVQVATRVTALAGPALTNQAGSNTTSPSQTNQYVQYGIWTIGVALIAYGTNRIRRG